MKRLVDIGGSLLMLILTLPVMIVVALLIRIGLGRPVLFRQERPGKGGVVFTLYKFRSMSEKRDASGELLPDEERQTALGARLRALSLDELPQLWNVLRGELSLVGPRPLLVEYLPLYTSEQARRHEVKPGITGWAQVRGRNALTWEDKLALDVWYVDHRSFWLDLKILWWTLGEVLQRRGIGHAGGATMPRFTGSREKGMT